jgi:hypothetical protein
LLEAYGERVTIPFMVSGVLTLRSGLYEKSIDPGAARGRWTGDRPAPRHPFMPLMQLTFT